MRGARAKKTYITFFFRAYALGLMYHNDIIIINSLFVNAYVKYKKTTRHRFYIIFLINNMHT
jgi:hypothetical protein